VVLALVLAPLRNQLEPGTAALLMLVAPLIAAGGGLRVAAGASVVSALTLNFLFTRPFDSFAIASKTNIVALVMYFAIALAFGAVIARMRRESERSGARASEADLLRELTVDLLRQSTWLQSPFEEATHKLQASLQLTYVQLEIVIEGGEHFSITEGNSPVPLDDQLKLPIAAGEYPLRLPDGSPPN